MPNSKALEWRVQKKRSWPSGWSLLRQIEAVSGLVFKRTVFPIILRDEPRALTLADSENYDDEGSGQNEKKHWCEGLVCEGLVLLLLYMVRAAGVVRQHHLSKRQHRARTCWRTATPTSWHRPLRGEQWLEEPGKEQEYRLAALAMGFFCLAVFCLLGCPPCRGTV
jgi:hypothetical protein